MSNSNDSQPESNKRVHVRESLLNDVKAYNTILDRTPNLVIGKKTDQFYEVKAYQVLLRDNFLMISSRGEENYLRCYRIIYKMMSGNNVLGPFEKFVEDKDKPWASQRWVLLLK